MGSEGGTTDDTKAEVRTDGVSIFWLTLAAAWTLLLTGGIAFLYHNRKMPLVKIRGLYLSIAAIALLHPYWFVVQLVYTIGPIMPEEVEYWCMGVYLPCGIALFQASNARFLYIAKKQRRYLNYRDGSPTSSRQDNKTKSTLARFREWEYTNRMFVYVTIGVAVQLFLTVFMYLISRKFHPSFGIPGTEVTGTIMQQKTAQGRGWEWWPSIFWQFIWAWIVAPVILWQARGIHDTLGWRFQTIACCLSGLPATPMWLLGIYCPGMDLVNEYFLPPQWIAAWVLFLEIFTVFVPCWQVLRHQSLRQDTLESIAAWESKNKSYGGASVFSGSTKVSRRSEVTWKYLGGAERGSFDGGIYTMEALESVLERNPEPLREFSALRDFSGENIAFLTAVSEWKKWCARQIPRRGSGGEKVEAPGVTEATGVHVQGPELSREPFSRALRIYVDYVSPRDAEFSINIGSGDLKRLESVFEGAARLLYGDRNAVTANPVTPFEDMRAPSPTGSERPIIEDKVRFSGEVPNSFSAAIFDEAERSIKYLVLTNTWPKFVRERRYSIDSSDSGFTLESHGSDGTLARAKRYLGSVRTTFSLKG